jgi:spermidine synthase
MGVTANCLAQSFGGHIDIAELSPEVVRTSTEYFNHFNENVYENSDVSIHYEDGRSFLLRSEKIYDLITSNAVHARLGANLYTTDFYEICKGKLSEDGYMCQWLPTNWLSTGEFKSLVRSFTEIFPNTQLWYVTRGHMLLLGTKSEAKANYQKFLERFNDTEFFTEVQEIGIYSPEMFGAHLFAGDEDLRKFAGSAELNTDDHPVVEFSMATDLRPNPQILTELGNINTDFDNSFFIEDKEEEEHVLYQLKTINKSYKDELLTFSKDFYHLFESGK